MLNHIKRIRKKLSVSHRLKVIKTLRRGKGELNGNWKGGRTLKGDGYVLLRMPDHPNAFPNGYFPEHRFVIESKLGRLLEKWEVVHHINGDKQDNRIENLVVTTHSLHGKEHWKDPVKIKERSNFMKDLRAKRFWSTKKH